MAMGRSISHFGPTGSGALLKLINNFIAGVHVAQIPFGIGATSNLYGIEGFHLKDVIGVVALSLQSALSTRPMIVDIETRGDLTRGMSVIDARPARKDSPNVELVVDVDLKAVRDYINRTLRRS